MSSVVKRVFVKRFERIAAVALLCSIVAGIAILVLDKKLCLTQICQEVSMRIINRLNRDADPCEDFYEFACGQLLLSDFEVDDGNSFLLSEAERKQKDKVRSLMVIDDSSFGSEAQNVVEFIRLCENGSLLEQAAKELLQIKTDHGLFPSVNGDKFDEDSWSLRDAFKKLREMGLDFGSMFETNVYYDPSHPRQMILSVSNPRHLKFSLANCDHLCKSDYEQNYLRILKAFNSNAATGERDVQDVMNFEKELVQNAIKNEDELKPLQLKECIKEISALTESYGFLDWKEYMKIVLRSEILAKNISNTTKVLVFNADYLEQLNKIISDKPSKVLANYVMWYALRPITERSCRSWVEYALPIPLQKRYLERFSSLRRMSFIIEMVHIIQNELKESIGLLDWMKDNAKRQANSHIDEIYLRLVSLDSLDQYEYKTYYDNADRSGNFTFLLNMYKKWLDKKFQLLATGVDRYSWDLVLMMLEKKLYSVNLMYTSADNSLTVLDGFLQQPVHDEDWPGYLNYGRLGSSVGHVLIHSLDYRDIHFDQNGKPRDWWDDESRATFKFKEECFLDQHTKWKNDTHNGYNNSDPYLEATESIADTGGLLLGFEAYQKFVDSLIFQDLLLPGVNYTQEQMYFMSYAQLYCSRDLDPISKIDDTFLPSKYRVSSGIQNNDYFGDVFKCKKDAKMNPTKKCEVWV